MVLVLVLLSSSGWAVGKINTPPVLHLQGIAQHLGYHSPLDQHFQVGERLYPLLDQTMPQGYQRIYLYREGNVVGYLPESMDTQQFRSVLMGGGEGVVIIDKVDPERPVYGVTLLLKIASHE
ncbi:hypothetical protein BOW53_13605 [Solemya pervernicosa gill symbiont]|uniref:HIRAN domain-containing protein n=1 Tax=Solemya pervernicosa gill symbiont TaxID=642797 RepID=A0A1T2L1W1_9GAMM|nr:hypothetical protein BOW53_13605 [Solemya pervernicosa gill symbiont]